MDRVVIARKRRRVYELFVSALVATILGAQFMTLPATALLKPVGEWFWPIMDYPMYAGPGYEGGLVDSEFLLFVVLDDAHTRSVSREELGLNVFHYFYLANGMVREPTPLSAKPLLALLKDRARVREVIVRSSGRVIMRSGVSQQAPKVLARILIDGGDR